MCKYTQRRRLRNEDKKTSNKKRTRYQEAFSITLMEEDKKRTTRKQKLRKKEI